MMGAPEPRPLRSSTFPLGLPHLTADEAARVNKANDIYRNIARLVRECVARNVLVSVENPTRSYLWETPYFQELIDEGLLHEVAFQQCMWGSARNKWSSWYVSGDVLDTLAKTCDRTHPHAGGGVRRDDNKRHFAAADKAAYPQKLCDEVAMLVSQLATTADVVWVKAEHPPKQRKKVPFSMAAAGRQPRGNRFPALIPEFAFTSNINTALPLKLPQDQNLSLQQCQQLDVPHPSKLLKILPGEDREGAQPTMKVEVGIWRTPEQFLERALEISHPFDDSSGVDDNTKANIFKLLTEGCAARADRVDEVFAYYEARAMELQPYEDLLHGALDEERQLIVEGKRFLLFEEMCKDSGITDECLHCLQLNGVSLTGRDCPTQLFRSEDAGIAMSEEQLMKSARWSRRKLLGSKHGDLQSEEVRQAVWDITMDEVAKGWMKGPYNEEELTQLLGPLFVASRRFGLRQPDKVRQIDNLSESLVNSAFGASYKLDLAGVDDISVMARTFVEAIRDDSTVSVTKSGGSSWTGKLHYSWEGCAPEIGGRTLDLAAAYKQVLVSKRSLWCSVLAVDDPSGEKRLFLSQVLPFGAASSVYGFNKIARAIQIVGTKLFELIWSSYYDDFPQLDVLSAGDWAQHTAERFLRLIGWHFSDKESKRLSLSPTFSALGVEFCLEKARQGIVEVRNKESRIAQICDAIGAIQDSKSLTEAEASTLMGRLQFAESQTYGRAVSLHMKAIRQRACGKKAGKHLTEDMLQELRWARDFVKESCPRVLLAGGSHAKVLIFTDAALENNDQVGTLGMVALRVVSGVVTERFYFSESVPDEVMGLMQLDTKKIISGLELLAGIVGVVLMRRLECTGRMFLFVDNEAARACLISMNSSVAVHSAFLKFLNKFSSKQSIFMWVSRVPSASNPADKPSRLVCDHLQGFTRLSVPWKEVVQWLTQHV